MALGKLNNCGCAARAGVCGGAPGAGVAKTRLAVKVAAWWTIPVSSYCMCLLKSVPLEQHRIIGDAQVDGLGRVQRANRDLRLPDRMYQNPELGRDCETQGAAVA